MSEKRTTLETFLGRNVSYSSEKKKIYDNLECDSRSPFKKKTMADIFICAAVFGFKHTRREKLKDPKPQISAVAFNTSETALLLTIPIIDTGGIDILFDSMKAATIIQEYANGGINILENEMLSGGIHADIVIKMASDMIKDMSDYADSRQS